MRKSREQGGDTLVLDFIDPRTNKLVWPTAIFRRADMTFSFPGQRTRGRWRSMTSIMAGASMSLTAGCATMNVNSYVERGVDLRQYRTYNWGSPDIWSTGDPRLDNNRFFDERVRAQVEEQLDRSISYCADRACEPFIHDKGTLSVDLVEPRMDKLIWRGCAEASIDGVIDNQAWMESRIDEAVAKILARLPRGL